MSCEKHIKIEDLKNEQKTEFGIRHVQAILIFLSFNMAYCIRTSMSVAVIALTDTSREDEGIKVFHWDKKIQDYLLSSFFTGYVLMQIPGGQLAYKYGGNILMSGSLLINGVLSLLMPTILELADWKGAYACRIFQGLTQGIMMPSIHTLISKWAPVNERNRFGLFVYSGCSLGTIVGMYGSGKLAATSFGWPLIFYAVGVLSLIFGSIMIIFGAESPAVHKRISQKEKELIQMSLNQSATQKKRRTPWKQIFTSVPVVALQITHVGSAWGFLLMLTETPSYFKMAFGINVENSAALSALPPLVSWIVAIVTSVCADWLINKNIFKLTTVRKIFNTIGCWGSAAALVAITFVSRSQINLAVFLVVLISALDCFGGVGFMLNHIDLSPNYAGVLISITNCVAVGISNLAPFTVGYILTDVTDMTQWRLIFLTAAAFYFVCNFVYLIFGTSEKQPWDNIEEDKEEKEHDQPLIEHKDSKSNREKSTLQQNSSRDETASKTV